MEKIIFEPNRPQEIALKFSDGKLSEGRYGDQMFYSLVDGRCWYADMEVAEQIQALGIRAREPFEVECSWSGRKGDRRQWKVRRAGDRGGDDMVPALQRSIARAQQQRAVEPSEPPDWPDEPEPVVSMPRSARPGASVSAPAPAPALCRTVEHQPNGSSSNGHGSNGSNGYSHPAPQYPAPPTKVPLNIAVIELIQMVQAAMRVTGEQWGDQAKQDLVSTLLIQSEKEGWIAMWERPVQQ